MPKYAITSVCIVNSSEICLKISVKKQLHKDPSVHGTKTSEGILLNCFVCLHRENEKIEFCYWVDMHISHSFLG